MKVLLRRNVSKLGKIGEVVDVKPGYARNYLLPQQVAVQPTAANIKSVEADKARYLDELARQRADLETRAAAIGGREVTISARANEEGNLYGSIGPAQIVAAMAATGIFLDAGNIALDSPIRRLDKYDVPVVFGEDIKATIHVWVVRLAEQGAESSSPPDQDKTQSAD
jgi:large subunit ribosomal protein L9